MNERLLSRQKRIPLGLCSAPNTLMKLMNQVFKPFTSDFVVVYFYDILIFSTRVEEHLIHLRSMLEVLKNKKMYLNLKKCEFLTESFLGFIISTTKLPMDKRKVIAMQDWPTLTIVHNRFFIFYRRFIKNFSSIVAPIIDFF